MDDFEFHLIKPSIDAFQSLAYAEIWTLFASEILYSIQSN